MKLREIEGKGDLEGRRKGGCRSVCMRGRGGGMGGVGGVTQVASS